MATRTFIPAKEQSLLSISGDSKGTSLENHLPIGRNSASGDLYNGIFRGLLRFGLDFTNVSSISNATLRLRLTTQVHVQPGPQTMNYVRAYRIATPWTSDGGGPHLTQEQKTTTWTLAGNENYGTFSFPSDVDDSVYAQAFWHEDTLPINAQVLSFDVTSIVNSWFSGQPNHGFFLKSQNESAAGTGSNHCLEFHGMRGQYPPSLTITYTYDPPPGAPTLESPPTSTTGTEPSTFAFSWLGDSTIASYDIQVGTTLGGSNLWNVSSSTTGLSSNAVSRSYAGSSIPHGQTIYWRARGTNTIGDVGPWSAGTFYVYAAPNSPTFVKPTSISPYAYIHNLNDLSVWSGSEAKPRVTLSYSHPDGIASTSFQIDVGGTVTTHTVSVASGGSYSFDVPTAIARATNVSVRARVSSLDGQWSSWTTPFNMKVNWSQGVFAYSHGAGVYGLKFGYSPITGGSETSAAFAFRKSNGTPGTWCQNISDVAPDTDIQVLVRLSTTNSAQNPSLPDMTLTYTTAGDSTPDHWSVSGGSLSLSEAVSFFGARSTRVTPSATSGYLRASSGGGAPINVVPGRTYTWSAYVNTGGGALSGSGVVGLKVKNANGDVIFTGPDTTSDSSSYTDGWQRLTMTFAPLGVGNVYPEVYFTNNGTYDYFYIDCGQLEEGERASGWRPGHLGKGASIDVGGITIDSTYGTIFRLKGSLGGVLDTVSLGTRGLVFGDTQLYGSSTGNVTLSGGLTTTNGITAGGNTAVTGTMSVSSTLTVGNLKPIVRTYTTAATNTWTKPSGLSHIVVELYGGGGGGGGCVNPGGSTQAAAGIGGSGGGYALKLFTAADLAGASSFTVTVGGGGTGGAAGANNGTVGSATTFSGTGITTVTASNGALGLGGANQNNIDATTNGINGSASTNGDINLPGEASLPMRILTGGKVVFASGGGRGAGPLGGSGGRPIFNANGLAGVAPGGGGGGGNQSGASAARSGGNGAVGMAVITEYYLP